MAPFSRKGKTARNLALAEAALALARDRSSAKGAASAPAASSCSPAARSSRRARPCS